MYYTVIHLRISLTGLDSDPTLKRRFVSIIFSLGDNNVCREIDPA